MREAINQELHARPYVKFAGPAHVLHLSFVAGLLNAGGDAPADDDLAGRLEMRPTYETPRHSIHAKDVPGVGHLVLTSARHTSYTAYTLILYGLKETLQPAEPFGYDLAALLPDGWLAARHGALLNATRLSVVLEGDSAPPFEAIAAMFDRNVLTASRVMGGAGTAWSDFRLGEDGCGRILLVAGEMSRHALGRTVQRLLNAEDYYHLVLRPLEGARALQPKLAEAESRLHTVMQAIAHAETMADKRVQLDALMALAAEIEHDLALHTMRFSPAFSYFALLKTSFEELREAKVPGLLPMSVFVLRRVNPAVQTYTTLQERLEAMSRRIARAADLLRTAIELNLGEQNQTLLAGMNDRARAQLRLQETVEGLSVIAISYYAIGLLSYALKGLKAAGWHVDSDMAVLWALPIVVGVVWFGGLLMRRRLHR